MGGEKSPLLFAILTLIGSPPRGRGKVLKKRSLTCWLGITPAWAGKRGQNYHYSERPQDHPRVGGEKFNNPLAAIKIAGSPPRGRGKVLLVADFLQISRITPAWAGKR